MIAFCVQTPSFLLAVEFMAHALARAGILPELLTMNRPVAPFMG
jgi:hypothetical protein